MQELRDLGQANEDAAVSKEAEQANAALQAEEAQAAADALVYVPADDSVTHCAICGERFVKSFDEEEEEWLYRGAVRVELRGRSFIFHKRCFDDQQASTSGLDLDNFAKAPRHEVGGGVAAAVVAEVAMAGSAQGGSMLANVAAVKQEEAGAGADDGAGAAGKDNDAEDPDHRMDTGVANAAALAAVHAARKTRKKRARF